MYFGLPPSVKPHSPGNISVKCDDFDATNCTVSWQDQQEMGNFRLRYRPIGSNSWTMRGNITARRYVLWDLKQNSEYEFQVSGRFLPNRGLWSDWSMSYQIEAVPFGPNDTWYIKKDVPPRSQNITLFWKVSFPVQQHNSEDSHRLCFPASPLPIEDLPPPHTLSAVSIGNGTIFVEWKVPLTHSQFISGYVVEWAKFHQGRHSETYSDWLKIPESKLTVKIENLEPNVCYRIGVFALYQDRAGKAASITGDASARAPLLGPQINLTVNEGGILVSWGEIPEDLQRGCIISYKIYLQKQFYTIVPKVYDIPKDAPQPFSVKNLQPGAGYALWMTAATKAGESPRGNEEMIYIKTCVCFVPSARRMVFSILSVFLSGWCSKAIPDPANSSWAKEFISVKDESSLYSTPFLNQLHCFEEPETLQIEEIFIKKFPVYKDVLLFRSTEKGEGHGRPTGSSSQEDGPTVKDSDSDPLATSTLYNANSGTQQPPSLYRKVAPEEPAQGQMLSEYLANPLEDETDYLPLTISTALNPNEDSGKSEFNSFSGFPRTSFAPQTFPFGGTLTLDAVRMDCNSFTD
ncbi:hypothetical protein lerEdw1_011759 [Lerista edwardsae]|nr:hypothetical protein lerEdw1_011759 [Lerista edwardsae]